jgi:arginyl-tRNA synthetase
MSRRGPGARAASHRFLPQRSRRGFHQLWNKGNDDPDRRFLLIHNAKLTRARLELASAIGQIIRNGLGIMGVAAAEEMQ